MTSKRVMTSDGGFTLEGLTKTAPKRYATGGYVPSQEDRILSYRSGPVEVPNASAQWGYDVTDGEEGYFWDPGERIQTGSYTSEVYPDTYGPGYWWRLEAGIWMINSDAYWEPNSTGDRIFECLHIDNRYNIEGLDAPFLKPHEWQMMSTRVYEKGSTLPANGQAGVLGFFFISPEMIEAEADDSPSGSGWAMILSAYQTSGAPLDLTAYALVASRIA